MSEIITKINGAVQKYNMLNDGDYVVAGVSGGADSMLLLNYLISVKDEYNLKITVANVEHGIRGEESLRDTEFVKKFCLDNGVDFKSISINAIEESKQAGMGVEEYSREKRYDFFKSFNADKIATAHNLSDNVETVLFRLSRGTSIKGCCGIPAVRGNIIRPLINCTGDEIRDYCKEQSIHFVVDSTNSDTAYTRNYIRNEIVPKFKELNPSFETVFQRFIDSAIDDEECLNNEANKCFDECFKKGTLLIDRLNKYPKGTVKRAIIKLVSLYDVTLDDCHLNGVYNLVNNPGRYQIKGNIFAVSDKKRLRIAVFQESLDFGSVIVNKKITSRADFLNNCELYRKEFDFYCDYDKIIGSITVRPRESGDEISPAGRDCTKSLKKLYNELKIPVEDRDGIPVILDDKGVIGIYGYCCDERVKIDNTTNSVILINIRAED